MTAEFTLSYLVSEFGPTAVVLLYLFLRDRKMENAILKLAEETEGVKSQRVRDELRVSLRGD